MNPWTGLGFDSGYLGTMFTPLDNIEIEVVSISGDSDSDADTKCRQSDLSSCPQDSKRPKSDKKADTRITYLSSDWDNTLVGSHSNDPGGVSCTTLKRLSTCSLVLSQKLPQPQF